MGIFISVFLLSFNFAKAAHFTLIQQHPSRGLSIEAFSASDDGKTLAYGGSAASPSGLKMFISFDSGKSFTHSFLEEVEKDNTYCEPHFASRTGLEGIHIHPNKKISAAFYCYGGIGFEKAPIFSTTDQGKTWKKEIDLAIPGTEAHWLSFSNGLDDKAYALANVGNSLMIFRPFWKNYGGWITYARLQSDDYEYSSPTFHRVAKNGDIYVLSANNRMGRNVALIQVSNSGQRILEITRVNSSFECFAMAVQILNNGNIASVVGCQNNYSFTVPRDPDLIIEVFNPEGQSVSRTKIEEARGSVGQFIEFDGRFRTEASNQNAIITRQGKVMVFGHRHIFHGEVDSTDWSATPYPFITSHDVSFESGSIKAAGEEAMMAITARETSAHQFPAYIYRFDPN